MCGEEIRRSFFAVRIGINARLEAKVFEYREREREREREN